MRKNQKEVKQERLSEIQLEKERALKNKIGIETDYVSEKGKILAKPELQSPKYTNEVFLKEKKEQVTLKTYNNVGTEYTINKGQDNFK